MKNMMKNEPKGYGTHAHDVWQPQPHPTAQVNMEAPKKGIPAAKTNMTGPDKAFDGGRSSGVCYTHDRKCSQ
jgi:hypothetical protein